MKNIVLTLLVVVALSFQQCKEDEDDFVYCNGCPIEAWIGYFEGSGAYFTASSGETTDGIEVMVNIENNYASNLSVKVEAPGYINESFSASKNDGNYYMNMGSGSRTLDIGLRKNGNEYRLDGTLKKNSWDKIDSVWVVNQSLTFQAYKK